MSAYNYGVYVKVLENSVTYRILVRLSQVFSETQTVYCTSQFMNIL